MIRIIGGGGVTGSNSWDQYDFGHVTLVAFAFSSCIKMDKIDTEL